MHSSLSSLAAAPPDPFLLAADLLDPPADPYLEDPVGFARDVLGFEPWSKQVQVMESVRDHARTAVRACHGVGKTATAAQVALWFLKVHRNSRVITTAPTWAQVEQLLWREIRAAVGRAHRNGLGSMFPTPSATKLELGDQWFAIGLSTNEPERFQGHHADHILLIVDEASGVDEDIFAAAEGFLTAQGAKVLMIGNPTRIGGTFHEAFTRNASSWSKIHISARDAPNETGEPVPAHVARALPRKGWVEEKAAEWGEDSAIFQVRALGEFPTNAVDAVIPLHLVTAAQDRSLPVPYPAARGDVVLGVDVARFGSDETVISSRHGPRIRIRETYTGKPLTETYGRVILAWQTLRQESGADPRIIVDDDGVGGGLTDMLRAAGYDVTGFNGAATPYQPGKYPNRRSEVWFSMADWLPDLDLDADDQLTADLTAPKYRIDDRTRRVVERKDDTKKRLRRSPDRADSVLLTLVRPLEVTLPDPALALPFRAPDDMPDWDAAAPRGGSLTSDLLNSDM